MQRIARITHRTARLVITLVLVAVTAASAAYLIPGLFGYERYVITGGSMSGTFEKGSLAFEKPVPVTELAVGDVITYLPPAESGVGTLVTHRITSVRVGTDGERTFRTQGDANLNPDPWKFSLVSETQPVVSHTVPYAGYLFIALADPQTRMLAIGTPAAVIALMALRDLIVALRSPRPRTGRTGRATAAATAAATADETPTRGPRHPVAA